MRDKADRMWRGAEEHVKRIVRLAIVAWFAGNAATWAQKPPLLPEKDVSALANELSGETAKRNLEGIARFHRQRGSQGFHAAAELVAERARAYGLSDVAILQFPADGKIFYGTQRSRPAWDAEVGELVEGGLDKEFCDKAAKEFYAKHPSAGPESIGFGCGQQKNMTIASYEAEPIVLAEDSETADVTTDLVDVGEGTKESDYAGKDVKGKLVLVGAQPGAVQDLAVGKFGAKGIVSYTQNQKTAWWDENENLIRWGHLETFSANKTFAFMVSLKTARAMKERLAKGERISLHAVVKAGQHPGHYEVVTATIPGADPKLKDEEIAFSCHLDHQRPGANDNASGCVTILEVARTLQKLISEGKLARPARTIRFIWPPEIEGTMALLNARPAQFLIYLEEHGRSVEQHQPTQSSNQPAAGTPTVSEFAKRIKAVVHMDMVGGGPETKAVFHVTRGPMSLPSFVHDVAWAFAEFVNEESYKFAATGEAEHPFVAPEGGKEPLRAEYSAYTMGSDHDVYQDSSFGIPAIYLNDWPDRYIHTNFDTAANIDPTKLKRAAFIGAASGYFLAGLNANDDIALVEAIESGELQAALRFQRHRIELSGSSTDEVNRSQLRIDQELVASLSRFVDLAAEFKQKMRDRLNARYIGDVDVPLKTAILVGASQRYRRNADLRGPLAVFGYDYFADHAEGAGVAKPKLLEYEGSWGGGEEYAYEILNLANGKRLAWQICDEVSAEYGPVPLELVIEYLKALEKIGIVSEVK
jgi:aminopeptidase YwaD